MLVAFVLPVCGLALLPPPGFALCVDADGHLVVEAATPGAARCCIGPDADADGACAPASCAECIDIAIASGDAPAVKQSRDADGAPLAHTPVLAPCAASCDVGTRRAPDVSAPRVATPPLRTVLLRI